MKPDTELAMAPSGVRSRSYEDELVSVIIPCFKQAHYLPESIASVLAQTHDRHEIIVVDDGSPDDTADVAATFPTVRYIRQENRGLPAARNTGVRASRGAYLVFLDADDRLLPHHFETAMAAFRRRPALAMVAGDYRWFGAEDTWHVHNCSPAPDYYAAMLRTGFIGPPHNVMIKRKVVLEVGAFREYLASIEDLDFWFRVARAYPMHCHCAVVAEYRRHPEQMSRKWDVMLTQTMKVMQAQLPYVQGNPVYEAAYRDGVRRHQFNCGTPLMWQMVGAIRQKQWRQAWGGFRVLVRCYPRGLAELLVGKVKRLVGLDERRSGRVAPGPSA